MSIRVILSLLREFSCCNKESITVLPGNRTYKTLNIRLADDFIWSPFLSLHINQGKAELVLHDDSVNSIITRSDCCMASISYGTISHLRKKINNEFFKGVWRNFQNLTQQIRSKTCINLLVCVFKLVIGCKIRLL